MTSLFPEGSIQHDGPWGSRETFHAYISRHSDPIATQARARIDTWFVEYPALSRPELLARIDGDEVAFYSVYFELLFHHLLLKQGLNIQIHPDLGFPTRPDFLATSNSGEDSVIVEVTAATAASRDLERGKILTVEEIREKINSNQNSH